MPEELSTLIAFLYYSKILSQTSSGWNRRYKRLQYRIYFCKFFLLLPFYNCNINILYLWLSIKFCLNNSSQTDTNSFLIPVFPAALLAISISNLSTSAIGSHGKMMVETKGAIPFPVYRSFSFQIGFNMCFHFQLC